jgi:hypothetical protein
LAGSTAKPWTPPASSLARFLRCLGHRLSIGRDGLA